MTNRNIGASYHYVTGSISSGRFNHFRTRDRAFGISISILLFLIATKIRRGFAWRFIPGVLTFVIYDGLLSRKYWGLIGGVQDFT